jgi:hypothetical protein
MTAFAQQQASQHSPYSLSPTSLLHQPYSPSSSSTLHSYDAALATDRERRAGVAGAGRGGLSRGGTGTLVGAANSVVSPRPTQRARGWGDAPAQPAQPAFPASAALSYSPGARGEGAREGVPPSIYGYDRLAQLQQQHQLSQAQTQAHLQQQQLKQQQQQLMQAHAQAQAQAQVQPLGGSPALQRHRAQQPQPQGASPTQQWQWQQLTSPLMQPAGPAGGVGNATGRFGARRQTAASASRQFGYDAPLWQSPIPMAMRSLYGPQF